MESRSSRPPRLGPAAEAGERVGEPFNTGSSRLILVGTVHGDPRGYERAWKMLCSLRPDLITVEISRFSLRYRQKEEHRWRRLLDRGLAELPPETAGHPALQRLEAQIGLPFEYRAARDYSRHCGIRCRPLDLGDPARRHLPRYAGELLGLDNLRALAATETVSLEDYVQGEFRRARLAAQRTPWRLFPHNGAENLRRERFLARRLRRLAPTVQRVVHLGGWEHLIPWRDGTGLLRWLADLQPRVVLVDDADSLSLSRDGRD